MRIGFTGHRDRRVEDRQLAQLAAEYPGALWVHGGAVGFDSQVAQFAAAHGIATEVRRPEYALHGKAAPHIRNRAIVEGSDLLIACYDGRATGGTAVTVRYAQDRGGPVRIWRPSCPVKDQQVGPGPGAGSGVRAAHSG